MSLAPGVPLGRYQILGPLGAGGMGEVYRARDRSLDRDVAIKVLPESLADEPERLLRLEREAKVLASLNHPNVAAIHGFEQADGRLFLVLELVEGEDLSARIARGNLELDDAIEIARQIALALSEAHGRGVVHRDLKPANVKLTSEGQVKVLDFGLAKAWAGDEETDRGATDLTHSPTLTQHATRAGVLLGTAAYMAPEQARGKPVDQRADLWSFGVVLWEMLVGRQLFAGETVSDVLAAVLTHEPDRNQLPPDTPPPLRTLLRRCLERDPRRRLHAAADAVLELDDAAAWTGDPAEPPSRRNAGGSTVWRILAACLALAGFLAGWLVTRPGAVELMPATKARFSFAGWQELGAAVTTVDISPDGRWVAWQTGKAIHLRELDAYESILVAGTEGGEAPFFSPDSRWLGFMADGKLRKVPVTGGPPIEICPILELAPGAAWGPDGDILFTPKWVGSGLWRVDGDGGEPREISKLRAELGETSHIWPDLLPDDRHVLFTVFGGRGLIDSQVAVLDLETGEHSSLFRGARPTSLEAGLVLYHRDGAWFTVPFDPRTRATLGEARPLDFPVRHLDPTGTNDDSIGFSDRGVLVYLPGNGLLTTPRSRLVWIDRDGTVSPLPFEARHQELSLSPDSGKLVTSRYERGQFELWLYDLQLGTEGRLSFEGQAFEPKWLPDGRRVSFTSLRAGNFDLHALVTDGSRPAVALVESPIDEDDLNWNPDGTTAAFTRWTESGRQMASLEASAEPEVGALPGAPGNTDLVGFSRDGRWIAYVDESGTLFVASWPEFDNRVTVRSEIDEFETAWSPGTDEIFLVTGRQVVAVPYSTTSGRFQVGAARPLFELPSNAIPANFEVDAEGQRFLFRVVTETGPNDQVRVVVDGFGELERSTGG